jgi:hypothetical protein
MIIPDISQLLTWESFNLDFLDCFKLPVGYSITIENHSSGANTVGLQEMTQRGLVKIDKEPSAIQRVDIYWPRTSLPAPQSPPYEEPAP